MAETSPLRPKLAEDDYYAVETGYWLVNDYSKFPLHEDVLMKMML